MNQLLKQFGLDSIDDLFSSLVGYKSGLLLALQLTAASLVSVVGFVKLHVFDPPVALYTLVILLVADTFLGAYVAIQAGEKFNLAKFTRLIPILLANVFVLHVSHKFRVADELFFWLPNAVFGFISTKVFLSVIRNLVLLKLLKADFLVWIASRIEPEKITQTFKRNEKPNDVADSGTGQPDGV